MLEIGAANLEGPFIYDQTSSLAGSSLVPVGTASTLTYYDFRDIRQYIWYPLIRGSSTSNELEYHIAGHWFEVVNEVSLYSKPNRIF